MENAGLMRENHRRDGKGKYEDCDGDSPDAKHHLETKLQSWTQTRIDAWPIMRADVTYCKRVSQSLIEPDRCDLCHLVSCIRHYSTCQSGSLQAQGSDLLQGMQAQDPVLAELYGDVPNVQNQDGVPRNQLISLCSLSLHFVAQPEWKLCHPPRSHCGRILPCQVAKRCPPPERLHRPSLRCSEWLWPVSHCQKKKMMTRSKQNEQVRCIKHVDKFCIFGNWHPFDSSHRRRAWQGAHFICPVFTAKINYVLDSMSWAQDG